MKTSSLLATLALAALAPTLAHAGLDNGSSDIHPLVGAALTGGGDRLESLQDTNGVSRNITAGGLLQVWAGAEWHPQSSPFAVQGTVGYHFDASSHWNGSQHFERFPFELIGLYSVAPQFRVGVGVRYAAGAKFHSEGGAYAGNYNFKSNVAGLVMGEWLITPAVGVQLRYVNESYKLDGQYVDGSHGGIGVNYYF